MPFFYNIRRGVAAAAVAIGLWSGLASAAAPQADIAYVLLGPNGQRIARIITNAAACPAIVIDGKSSAMSPRTPVETVPQRATVSDPTLSKPSVFDAQSCEAVIPASATRAETGGIALPLPPKTINRIVVIGDTGCRLKAADNAAQGCNDPAAYPFSLVAAAAAAWKPDAVLHVGDYVYRENPCPGAATACSGSPWGYGLDSWKADFFTPAEKLLRAAPWIAVRGNHESCDRAGQGWQRFMDPYPFSAARSCDDPASDMSGDFTQPFAVGLGNGAQVIVWDTSITPAKHFTAGDPKMARFAQDVQQITQLAARAPHNFLTNHQPPLAFAAKQKKKTGEIELSPVTESLQDVLGQADPMLFPRSIDVLLSGHVHVWEQLSFGGRYPSQIITGFSGTLEDIVPIPETLPPDSHPAPGVAVEAFSSWVDGFGFMTLERQGADKWRAEIHDKQGKIVNHCTIEGRLSHCDLAQVHAG